jgi:hypothetical protein
MIIQNSMEEQMKRTVNILTAILIMFVLAAAPFESNHQMVIADATSKTLATNYTLVNLGSATATVTAQYLTPAGTEWGSSIFKNFSIPAGGNQIVRQYDDTGLTPGRGSVILSSDQPLGAMVQEITRSGVPTMGAYSGVGTPSATWYVPLAARQANSATGKVNSQIIVQNVGAAAVDFTVEYFSLSTGALAFSKNYTALAIGASELIDLDLETGLTAPWWGSVVVSTASGSLGVVSNIFFGADSLNAFNAFAAEEVTYSWRVPLLYVRLTNTLTTSLTVQNLSGATLPAGDIQLACVKNPAAPGADFTIVSTSQVLNKSSYTFNTYTDTTNFPTAGWYGSCEVKSLTNQNIAVLVQDRYTKNAEQSMYGAVPGNLTSQKVSVPLVAKRLANGFANTVTIQNLGTTDATLTITYNPTGGGTPIVRSGIFVAPGASYIRNFRLAATESPDMPDGWVGSMVIESNTPIAAFVQNTYLTAYGDRLMAYLGFNN